MGMGSKGALLLPGAPCRSVQWNACCSLVLLLCNPMLALLLCETTLALSLCDAMLILMLCNAVQLLSRSTELGDAMNAWRPYWTHMY